MEQLVPDQLKQLWQLVDRGELTADGFGARQEHLLAAYRQRWTEALLLEGYDDLEESLLGELGRYVGCDDHAELRRRCSGAVAELQREWQDRVDQAQRAAVERFYDETRIPLYELTWWHTLTDDLSPLASVVALDFAKRHGCTSCLDFGAGIGSSAILFARQGVEVAIADISSPLLEFARWRLDLRGLPGLSIDLKDSRLPRERFDLITAMDVFEHLVDPVSTAEELVAALRPGSFLFGRFGAHPDDTHPMHIVQDFEPTFARLRGLGCAEVWRDEWLWGHQAFQKP